MIRRALPAALALVLAGGIAFAQQPQPAAPDAQAPAAPAHAPNPHRQAMKLARELNLTPDQTAKLEPILADRDRKIAALGVDSLITPGDAERQRRAIRKNTVDQMNAILTPEQSAQLKALQHSHAPKGQTQALTPPSA